LVTLVFLLATFAFFFATMAVSSAVFGILFSLFS